MPSFRFNQIELVVGKWFVWGPLLLFCIALGLLNVLPHMHEALWQDEAATIAFHASRGMIDPFIHYISPNSHPLFSSLLAGWIRFFPGGMDLFTLRLLPLLLFLVAIPATFAAGYRLAGAACGSLTAVLFASSAVTANFATQIRGYGPSWLFFSLALLCALGARSANGKLRWWQLGYFLSGTAATAILPTNFYFLMALSASVFIAELTSPAPVSGRKYKDGFILLATPVLGLLLAYSSLWRELASFSSLDFSAWTRGGLITEWLRGSLASFKWIAPLAGAGAAAGIAQLLHAARVKRSVEASVLLSILIVLGFLVSVAVTPNPPFPRTLVPFLPVWLCAISHLILHGARSLIERQNLAASLGGATLVAVLVFATPAGTSCRNSRGSGDRFDYDLCHQYFRDAYHPEQVLDVWASLPVRLPIVTDYEGVYALRILDSPAQISEYQNHSAGPGARPLIVAHDPKDMSDMATAVGLDPATYSLAADTGYFKVYRYSAQP